MKNTKPIIIISDTIRPQELESILNNHSEKIGIKFELIEDKQVTRSFFDDPVIVAALINAAAITVSSLISLIGVIWVTRQKDKKANNDTVIEIKIKNGGLKDFKKNQPQLSQQVSNMFDNEDYDSDILELPPHKAATLDLNDNPYEAIFEELEIEHIAIIEKD